VSNPYYEAPTYRTGTSQTFDFTSGAFGRNEWNGAYPDENTLTGITRNIDGTNVLAWEFDLKNSAGTRNPTGSGEYFYFVPGTVEDNGTWFHNNGTVGTRSGRAITISSFTFDETKTKAFVNGLVIKLKNTRNKIKLGEV
jgi:hypothetical protein